MPFFRVVFEGVNALLEPSVICLLWPYFYFLHLTTLFNLRGYFAAIKVCTTALELLDALDFCTALSSGLFPD